MMDNFKTDHIEFASLGTTAWRIIKNDNNVVQQQQQRKFLRFFPDRFVRFNVGNFL